MKLLRNRILSFRPTLEVLEDRTVPAVFVVDSEVTLRAAILQANADSIPDTIQFALSPTDPVTGPEIVLTSPLPDITQPLTIDGSALAGAVALTPSNDRVTLRPSPGLVGMFDGLVFAAGSSGSSVTDMRLFDFSNGIRLQ